MRRRGSRRRHAVISYRAWRDIFGGDSSIVGRTIRLDGREVPVVGVMPAGFEFPWEKVDVWTSDRLESGAAQLASRSAARIGCA